MVAPVLVGLAVLVLQAVVFYRDLDARWRSAALALTPIPLLLGIAAFVKGLRSVVDAFLDRTLPGDSPHWSLVHGMQDSFLLLIFPALITGVLLIGCAFLHAPVRHGRKGPLWMIWGFSVLMILIGMASGEFIHGEILSPGLKRPGFSAPGIITAIHRFLTGDAGWFILIWLIAAAVSSVWLDARYRLRIAYGVACFAMLLTLLACLMLVKVVVVVGSGHSAIAGRSWVDFLNVHSW